tara:strand:- start:1008 stop:1358 length:351 start_codon:yes stop_codon:yes gene_type:complete
VDGFLGVKMHDSKAIADNANAGIFADAGLLPLIRVKAKSLALTRFAMKGVEAVASDGINGLECYLVFKFACSGTLVALLRGCFVKDSRGLRGGLPSCLMPPVVLLLSALYTSDIVT